MNKRRVGLGFTGLGDALIMLRPALRQRGRARHGGEDLRGACATAPTAPRASSRASAARFRCSTPTCTCRARSFASRLPADIKALIRKHGIRNSHLLSIAPTGTISLAFADNASNGIEPPFSWTYTRKKRMADGTLQGVPGRGLRLAPVQAPGAATWRSCRRYFVTALEISAAAHENDGGGGRALRRHQHLQDGQRAGELSVRRVPGPVHGRRGSPA